MLGIENKYKQFRDLNKILIKPCVDELNLGIFPPHVRE
ncbi:hypothetical protein [Escherichia coli]